MVTGPLSPLNLDEEYNNALRTKSFIDIYSKLHNHQKQPQQQQEEDRKEEDQVPEEQEPSDLHVGVVQYQDQEPDRSGSGDFRHLLVDFFNTTRQSTAALSSLLSSISLARSHHRSIHRLLLDLSQCPTSPQAYYAQLSSHLGHDNPLSSRNLKTFHAAHARYPELIRRLNRANRKIDRRLRMRRMIILVFGECRRRLERVKRRVDGAAKGAYIVGRDMDTVSRMVRRVEDEVEHGREVGRMVVRNIVRRSGEEEEEWGIVREVVKEIEGGRGERELGLEEQVEELEEITMETELQRLEFPQYYSRSSSLLINSPNNSSSCCTNVSIRGDEDFRYTSLKDIISSSTTLTVVADYPYSSPTAAAASSIFSSRRHSSAFAINNDFSSSTISIKNHLVKHAASVYLQSAAVLAARDQSWFSRMWRQQSSRRMRQRQAVGAGVGARWRECVQRPVEVCMGFLRRVMSCVAAQIVLIRSRTSIAFNS